MKKLIILFLLVLLSAFFVYAQVDDITEFMVHVSDSSGNSIPNQQDTHNITIIPKGSICPQNAIYSNVTTATSNAEGRLNITFANLKWNLSNYLICYYRSGVLKSDRQVGSVPYADRVKYFEDNRTKLDITNITNFFYDYNETIISNSYTDTEIDNVNTTVNWLLLMPLMGNFTLLYCNNITGSQLDICNINTTLDGRYVEVAGDTMTGDLTIDTDLQVTNIGIGRPASSTSAIATDLDFSTGIDLDGSLTGVPSVTRGINVQPTFSPTTVDRDFYALQFSGLASGSTNIDNLKGVLSGLTVTHTGTIATLTTFEDTTSWSGSGSLNVYYGLYIHPSRSSGSWTDGYGILLGDIDQATNNWAIKTGLGNVSFGDKVTIKQNLDVGGNTSADWGNFKNINVTGTSYLGFITLDVNTITAEWYCVGGFCYNLTFMNDTAYTVLDNSSLNNRIKVFGLLLGFNSTYNKSYAGSLNNDSYLSTYNISYESSLNNESYLSTYNLSYESQNTTANWLSLIPSVGNFTLLYCGNITGATSNLCTIVDTTGGNTTEEIQDSAWDVLGGTQTGITITYEDATDDVDFVVTDSDQIYNHTVEANETMFNAYGSLWYNHTSILETLYGDNWYNHTSILETLYGDNWYNHTQNLWATFSSDSGSTTADSILDILTISGAGITSTSIAGDILTITSTEAQNLWYTINSDSGSTSANALQDILTIAGSGSVSTAVVGDTLTITGIDTVGFDGNASSICGDQEVLLGEDATACINLNNTIDNRDLDTNATTECGADEVLDGDGDCVSHVSWITSESDPSAYGNFTIGLDKDLNLSSHNLTNVNSIQFNETFNSAPTIKWNGSCIIMQPHPNSGSLNVCY